MHFEGQLMDRDRPKMTKAEPAKLYIEVAGGAAIGVPLSDLSDQNIDYILLQTLGKDGRDTYHKSWKKIIAIAKK